jgi:biopolymer transport protein ExbB/TolQ
MLINSQKKTLYFEFFKGVNMGGFTFREMILNGWPVISILAIMSIISLTIFFDRLMTFRTARIDVKAFFGNLVRLIVEQGENKALDYCALYMRKAAASVAVAIIKQPGDRDAKERAAQHAIQTQIHRLEYYTQILGTIGSTAPFIGLFGTVMGIIKAFQNIAMNVGAGPEVVSAGIAEALITTAFGLLVAIPAVIFYNYCVRTVQRMSQEIDLASYMLIEALSEE